MAVTRNGEKTLQFKFKAEDFERTVSVNRCSQEQKIFPVDDFQAFMNACDPLFIATPTQHLMKDICEITDL